jgi:hypothetical protein
MNCDHDKTEDCLNCAYCGECSETLDELNEMCDDCRKKAAEVLEELRGLQAEFWSKLSELESVLNGELDSTIDFQDHDLQHLITLAGQL